MLVESIPRSGTGKYLKSVLRERFRDVFAVMPNAPPVPASSTTASNPASRTSSA